MNILVEIDHDFDIENFNKSARCMKCARQLFPDAKQQESWALYAWQQWQDHNIPLRFHTINATRIGLRP